LSGEKLIKKVYEALRASPQWEETLFLITYDEHGGFYDHVAPPDQGVPGDGQVRELTGNLICGFTPFNSPKMREI
jgi:phospholipase C